MFPLKAFSVLGGVMYFTPCPPVDFPCDFQDYDTERVVFSQERSGLPFVVSFRFSSSSSRLTFSDPIP